MSYGLDNSTLNNIISKFKNHPEVTKVILYGSRAKGNYRNGSDIDLVIIGDQCNIKTLYKIEEELEDLYLPYKFDISIFNDIDNLELIEHIQRVGKELYIDE